MTQNVLFVELPEFQKLPPHDVLLVACNGAKAVFKVSETEAIQTLKEMGGETGILIVNGPSYKVFSFARKHFPDTCNVLMTEFPMGHYSLDLAGAEDLLLDHVITNHRSYDRTKEELRITIQKLIRNDIFGLEKYLMPGTKIQSAEVTGSDDRENHNFAVMKLAEQSNLGQHIAKMAFGISEELLMNAVYDAPRGEDGHHYQNLPRTTRIVLKPHEYPTLNFGFDGHMFGIAIIDPFGGLTQKKLNEYLKKILKRRDSTSIIDSKKGGAGLGIFKILYSCHAFICNVDPGKRTEIIALIDAKKQLRDFSKMARSIHYFRKR